MSDLPKLREETGPKLADTFAFSVGDVNPCGDEWHFPLYCGSQHELLIFVFRSRKAVNVSRRLMKEIVARTASVRGEHTRRLELGFGP